MQASSMEHHHGTIETCKHQTDSALQVTHRCFEVLSTKAPDAAGRHAGLQQSVETGIPPDAAVQHTDPIFKRFALLITALQPTSPTSLT